MDKMQIALVKASEIVQAEHSARNGVLDALSACGTFSDDATIADLIKESIAYGLRKFDPARATGTFSQYCYWNAKHRALSSLRKRKQVHVSIDASEDSDAEAIEMEIGGRSPLRLNPEQILLMKEEWQIFDRALLTLSDDDRAFLADCLEKDHGDVTAEAVTKEARQAIYKRKHRIMSALRLYVEEQETRDAA